MDVGVQYIRLRYIRKTLQEILILLLGNLLLGNTYFDCLVQFYNKTASYTFLSLKMPMANVYDGHQLASTLINPTSDRLNVSNIISAPAIGNSPQVIYYYYYYYQQRSNPNPQVPLPYTSLTQLPPLLTNRQLLSEGAASNAPQPQVLLSRAMAPVVVNCYLPALLCANGNFAPALQLASSKLYLYPYNNQVLLVNPYHPSLMQPANQSFVNALSQQASQKAPLVWPPRVATAPSLMSFLSPTAFAQMANGVQNMMPAGSVPPQATSLMVTNESLDPNLEMLMTSARSVSGTHSFNQTREYHLLEYSFFLYTDFFAEKSNGSLQYTDTSASTEEQTCAEIQANASRSFNVAVVMNEQVYFTIWLSKSGRKSCSYLVNILMGHAD